MKTRLILYWYVKPDGWDPLYDLHIKNLMIFGDKFDKITLVISQDEDVDTEKCEETIKKIRTACDIDDIIMTSNDKQLREAKYFKEDVICNLDKFDKDEIVFFAHNKGVNSFYVQRPCLIKWINMMWMINLKDIDSVKSAFENEHTLCVGTYCKRNWDIRSCWYGYGIKYNWHYSGTFFWMYPNRLYEYIKENNLTIPEPNRYFAEGFFGNIMPDDDKYRKIFLSDSSRSESPCGYFNRAFDEKTKNMYYELYEK